MLVFSCVLHSKLNVFAIAETRAQLNVSVTSAPP